MIDERGLTLLGVATCNLEDDGAVQLSFPFDATAGDSLDSAVDEVRNRFGTSAVTRAVLLGHDPGPSALMLPD
jgi:DNA polymerase-4